MNNLSYLETPPEYTALSVSFSYTEDSIFWGFLLHWGQYILGASQGKTSYWLAQLRKYMRFMND